MSWPQRARDAAVASVRGSHMDVSIGINLLEDIRTCFREEDRISSSRLCDRLNEMEEARWGAWNNGDGIMPRDLAKILKDYEVYPKKVRFGELPLQGYTRQDLDDPWSRYLSGTAGTPEHELEFCSGPVPVPARMEQRNGNQTQCSGVPLVPAGQVLCPSCGTDLTGQGDPPWCPTCGRVADRAKVA